MADDEHAVTDEESSDDATAPRPDTEPDDTNVAESAEHDGPADAGDASGFDLSSMGPDKMRQLLNMTTLGSLTLHYARRDVTWVVEGDAAMRIMTVLSGSHDPNLADPISLTSSARNNWFVVDVTKVLAASWTPDGAAFAADRVTIDPLCPNTPR